MITKNALKSALAMVSSLEQNGHAIKIRNGHFDVLTTLVSPSRIKGRQISLEQAVEETLSTTASPLTMDYREQLNELRAIWQRPMIARIRMIREQVVPMLDDLTQSCINEYTTLTVTDPEVRPIKVTDIYRHEGFLEFIARHKPTTNQEITAVEFLGGQLNRSEEDIVKLMQTGSISLDDALMDMVASHPVGWLKETYDALFVNGYTFPAKLYNPWMQINQVDQIIVAYVVIASIIARDIIDPTVQMSLNDYRRYISNLLAECGRLINRYCYLLSLDITAQKVVAYYDEKDSVIHVHEALYNQYLSEGGTPESLIGAVRSGAPLALTSLINDVNADMSDYIKQNDRLLSDQKANFKYNFLQAFKAAFPKLLHEQTNELQHLFTQDPQDFGEDGRLDDMAVSRLTNMAVNAMNQYASMEVSKLIFVGVIDTLLSKYEFAPFLEAVNQQMAEGRPANEAVFYAVLAEIVDKLVSRNLRVVKMDDL